MATGLSLNLKLFTAPTTSPFSTRYTPSRVSPVSSSVCGSTSRMYQRQVSSRPRPVLAIMSSRDALLPGPSGPDGPSRIRFPMAGVTGRLVRSAVYRVWVSAARAPSRIQAVGRSASPLSKSEDSRLEACATTNGWHSRPSATGSLRSVTGRLASRSPTRVPPPGLLNTVRPSSASFAPDDQYR